MVPTIEIAASAATVQKTPRPSREDGSLGRQRRPPRRFPPPRSLPREPFLGSPGTVVLCCSRCFYCSRLDPNHPVHAEVEGQVVEETVHEQGTVDVEEIDEPDLTLLRVPGGERLCLGVPELAPQRVVLPLGGLDDLVVQLLQVLLHPAQRGARGPF